MADIPYANSTSGAKAREEIVELLRRIGCDNIGFMDKFETGTVLLAFEHRGRPVQMRASIKGWAAWFLRENPWNSRRSSTREQWEAKAIRQGMIAVNSILRDWCKGQVTAIECGIIPAEAAFLAIRDQCAAAGVAFFMKQMSGTRKAALPPIPDDLMIREFPRAGRLLDGREHNEMAGETK